MPYLQWRKCWEWRFDRLDWCLLWLSVIWGLFWSWQAAIRKKGLLLARSPLHTTKSPCILVPGWWECRRGSVWDALLLFWAGGSELAGLVCTSAVIPTLHLSLGRESRGGSSWDCWMMRTMRLMFLWFCFRAWVCYQKEAKLLECDRVLPL